MRVNCLNLHAGYGCLRLLLNYECVGDEFFIVLLAGVFGGSGGVMVIVTVVDSSILDVVVWQLL